MVQTKTNPQQQGQKRGDVAGVVKIVGQSQLPQEFITIGKNFEEALGRCVLRDDEQKNAVIVYKAQLEMFEMWDEIQDLTNWLNASAAVGGFNRSLAAMTYTGIYVPEGAGIRFSKENQKVLKELQKERAEAHSRGEGDNGNGKREQPPGF